MQIILEGNPADRSHLRLITPIITAGIARLIYYYPQIKLPARIHIGYLKETKRIPRHLTIAIYGFRKDYHYMQFRRSIHLNHDKAFIIFHEIAHLGEWQLARTLQHQKTWKRIYSQLLGERRVVDEKILSKAI